MKTKTITCTLTAIVAVALATILTLGFTVWGWGKQKTDWEYLSAKGKLTIGITEFAPMNYYEDGNLVGFDTEFALAVCEKLGLTAEFKIIEWGSKELELNSKNIDAVWNGLTWNETRASNMDLTDKYLKNKGVLIAKAGSQYATQTTPLGSGVKLAVELGSSAETSANTIDLTKNANIIAVDTGAKCFMEVEAGTVDVAYVDYLQAQAIIAGNNDYNDLVICDMEVDTDWSAYSVGLRKNSPETLAKFNIAIAELMADGTLEQIAIKYLGSADLLYRTV